MIASGYSVDLYCDITDGFAHTRFNGGQGQFYGETWQDCAKQAKAEGWLISRDRQRCVCPACAKAGKKLPKAD